MVMATKPVSEAGLAREAKKAQEWESLISSLRRLLVFRDLQESGGRLDLPALTLAINLHNAGGRAPSPEIASAAAWLERLKASGGAGSPDTLVPTLERVQLPPSIRLRGDEAADPFAGWLQPLRALQVEFVMGFVQHIFGTTSLKEVAKATEALVATLQNNGVLFLRLRIAESPGDQATGSAAMASYGIEAKLTLAPELLRRVDPWPIRAFSSDETGMVEFPVFVSDTAKPKPKAKAASVSKVSFSAFPTLTKALAQGGALRLSLADTRSGIVRTMKPQDPRAEPAAEVAIAWNPGSAEIQTVVLATPLKPGAYEQARKELAELPGGGLTDDSVQMLTDAELAQRLGRVAAPEHRAAMAAVVLSNQPSIRADVIRYLQADDPSSGGVNRLEQFRAFIYGLQLSDGLSNSTYRSLVGEQAQDGASYEDQLAWRAMLPISPSAYRELNSDFETWKDVDGKRVLESRPKAPLRARHWNAFADLVKQTVAAQGTPPAETAANRLARGLGETLAGVLSKRPRRALGALVYAFDTDRAGGVPMLIDRFADGWTMLDRIEEAGSQDQRTDLESAGATRDGPWVAASASGLQACTRNPRLHAALLAAGIDSVPQLTQLGEADAIRLSMLHRKSPDDFDRVDVKECRRSALALSQAVTEIKVSEIGKLQSSMLPSIAGTASRGGKALDPANSDFPNLRVLFGTVDLCACKEDDSVFGAAAYLVDVLEFLRHRLLAQATRTSRCGDPDPVNAMEVLFQRRPDLEHLDLGDANTTRPVPYIDLVNEVLESAIAGGDDVEVTYRQQIKGGDRLAAHHDLLQPLRRAGADVTPAAQFVSVKLPRAERETHHCREVLTLRDTHAVCRFQREAPGGKWDITRLRNTTVGAESLAAEPEYTISKAYANLDTATYSYALPFNLGEAQVDEFLALVQSHRREVDHPWLGATPQARGDRLRRCAAQLDMQLSLAALVAAEGDTTDEGFWNWVKVTGPDLRLSDFLRHCDLAFEALEQLARSVFLAGKGSAAALTLHRPSSARDCDSQLMTIGWSDQGKQGTCGLEVVSRFLRLQRHLGWTTHELDQAISAPRCGAGKLNLDLLEEVVHLRSLTSRMKLRIGEITSFFGVVPHAGWSDLTESSYWRLFLDPRRTGQDAFSREYALFLPQNVANAQELLAGPAVQAALALRLGLTGDELAAMIEEAGWTADAKLDHDVLSRLLGTLVVRKHLRLSWHDYFACVRLYCLSHGEQDIFAKPSATCRFLAFAELRAKACKLTPSRLLKTLTSVDLDPGGVQADAGPKPDQVRSLLLRGAKEFGRESGLALQAYAMRGSPHAIDELADRWSEEFAGGAQAGLARLIWEPIVALSGLIEADRLHGIETGSADHADLPSSEETSLDGPVFKEFAALFPVAAGEARPARATGLPAQVAKVFGKLLTWSGFGDSAQARMERASNLIQDLAIAAAQDQASIEGRLLVCLHAPFQAKLALMAREDAVASLLGPLLSLDSALLVPLLRHLTSRPAQGAVHAVSVFDEFVFADWRAVGDAVAGDASGPLIARTDIHLPEDAKVQAMWIGLLRAARVAALVQAMPMRREAWEWSFTPEARAFGLLDADALPGWSWARDGGTVQATPAVGDSARLLRGWLELARFAQIDERLAPVGDGRSSSGVISFDGWVSTVRRLHDKCAAATKPLAPELLRGVFEDLQRLSGYEAPQTERILRWVLADDGAGCDADTPEFQARLLGLLLQWPNYNRLDSAVEWLRQTGLPVRLLKRLCSDEISNAARDIRAAIKLRFAEKDWLGAVKAGQDRLRARKRDALVAYLIGIDARDRFRTADDLYEHYLIDTQMAPCMPSSRIVQAHATVQLFAQRCLMGLEPHVRIRNDQLPGWQAWEWMKNYRVWQAGRKVFLYPENWIEPEIRDDRSIFFRELQDELGQNKLGQRNVEDAVINYLHKLNEVARLEVCASYYEFGAEQLTLHMIARTRAEPRKYFYRRWIDEREWTAWEPIELEITGDHICVFMRGGRLHLAWMTSSVQEDRTLPRPTSEATALASADVAKGRWKFQLALSEYAESRWLPKRVGQDALLYPREPAPITELTDASLSAVRIAFQDKPLPEIVLTSVVMEGFTAQATPIGSFLLSTCTRFASALPVTPGSELHRAWQSKSLLPGFDRSTMNATRFVELRSAEGTPDDSLVLIEGPGPAGMKAVAGFEKTPGLFSVSIAQQASALDLIIGALQVAASDGTRIPRQITTGAWMPMFYEDRERSVALVERSLDGQRKVIEPLMRMVGSIRDAAGLPSVAGAIQRMRRELGRPVLDTPALAAAADQVLEAFRSEGVFKERALQVMSASLGEGKTAPALYGGRLFHPTACDLVRIAYDSGVKRLYWRDVQLQSDPSRQLAYQSEDGYASYNWEVFVHIPLLVARRFAGEGQYKESLKWFQFIFNPTGSGERQRPAGDDDGQETQPDSAQPGSRVGWYWIPRPFYDHSDENYYAQRIEKLIDPAQWARSDSPVSPEVWTTELAQLVQSIQRWRKDPVNPHLIARHRWVAFQKAIVFNFIQMLLDWADHCFRSDTREAITEATQLYVLAGKLLGERPIPGIPEAGRPTSNYEEIRVSIEENDSLLFERVGRAAKPPLARTDDAVPHLNIYNDYFCVPQNESLVALWDRMEDRLFKIRHCQNIDGLERVLALFSPAIDPGMLVRASAAGLSMDDILTGLNEPLPHYRFSHVAEKASQFAQEVRALGSDLLQIVERRDAEGLSLLRSKQEIKLLKSMGAIRKDQIREAKEQVAGLEKMIDSARYRESWFAGRKEVSGKEQTAMDLTQAAMLSRVASQVSHAFAGTAHVSIPTVRVGGSGFGGSPHFTLEYGGASVGNAANAFGAVLSAVGDVLQTQSAVTATLAGYERRKEDWGFQGELATQEIGQLEKQLAAAQIRLEIAQKELDVNEQQTENAERADEFMRSKFSGAQLFDWMLKRSTGVYYRAYQLALEFARKAERCLEFELPQARSGGSLGIVQPGHWDGLRKGLMSADGLIHDIRKLEATWLNRNRREFELVKTVALSRVNPRELLRLRSEGQCSIELGAALYDIDFPNQSNRRIKSVTLAVPCVTGPYTSVSCQLTLQSSTIFRQAGADPVVDPTPVQSICTSTGRDDGGLFEMNLSDERYLPFEGAGAISSWRLKFPGTRQFDWTSISDAVLTIRYTAQQAAQSGPPVGIEHAWPFVSVSLCNDLAAAFHRLTQGGAGPSIVRIPQMLASDSTGSLIDAARGGTMHVLYRGAKLNLELSLPEAPNVRLPGNFATGSSAKSPVKLASREISEAEVTALMGAGLALTQKEGEILDVVFVLARSAPENEN
jgi:hypothetical protein